MIQLGLELPSLWLQLCLSPLPHVYFFGDDLFCLLKLAQLLLMPGSSRSPEPQLWVAQGDKSGATLTCGPWANSPVLVPP